MSDISYDPKIIKEFSQNLYQKADTIIFINTLIGLFIGAGVGLLIGASIFKGYLIAFIIIGVCIGVCMGHEFGKLKALDIKAQAQMMLCITKIEENTKKT